MESKRPLLESAVPIGTMAQWKAGASTEVGVVVGSEGKDVFVVSMHSKETASEKSTQTYVDRKLTSRITGQGKWVQRIIHRIPRSKLQLQGAVKGRSLNFYKHFARLFL
jgi:ATP-dependent Clp protease ATP-binding subunit ClpA